MTPFSLTWIYEASDSPSFHLGKTPRFIEEIAGCVGVAAPLLEGPLCELAPDDGFILLNSFRAQESLRACSAERRSKIAARLIPIGMSSSRIGEQVLLQGVPACVDNSSYMEWSEHPTESLDKQRLVGLRSVAERMGVPLEPIEEYPDYGYITSDANRGLPRLVADYLITLHRIRSGRGE